jgi:hypothetical protein
MRTFLVLLAMLLSACGATAAAPTMTTSSFAPAPVTCAEAMCPPTDPPGTPGDSD